MRSVRGTGGGPEKTILLGTARTDRTRFEITICYVRDTRDNVFEIGGKAERLGLDYVELMERGSFDRRMWQSLRQLVRDREIDIVHAHDYKTDLLALLLAKTEGTTPIATAHGWTGNSARERWAYYPCDKQLLRAFPATIAVSSQIRSELIRAGARPDRVHVVLNGIDHLAFRRDRSSEGVARRDFHVAGNDVVIGAAGRLERQKRFDLLIQACAAVRERIPQLRLLIAGEGSLRGELEELGRRLLPPASFTLLGHRSDVVSFHHALDLFVQASDYEGTPNAVLEAMALETPIVATAAGGTAELVEDGVDGMVVPIGDVAALARAIEHTLLYPSEAAARVVRARRRVETSLSFDARMKAVERIYEQAIAARHGD